MERIGRWVRRDRISYSRRRRWLKFAQTSDQDYEIRQLRLLQQMVDKGQQRSISRLYAFLICQLAEIRPTAASKTAHLLLSLVADSFGRSRDILDRRPQVHFSIRLFQRERRRYVYGIKEGLASCRKRERAWISYLDHYRLDFGCKPSESNPIEDHGRPGSDACVLGRFDRKRDGVRHCRTGWE
jgi:hypothetical protein